MKREGFVRLQNKKEKKRTGKNNKGIVRDKRQAMEEKGFLDCKRREKIKGWEKIKQKENKKQKILKDKRQGLERKGMIRLQKKAEKRRRENTKQRQRNNKIKTDWKRIGEGSRIKNQARAYDRAKKN
jgi:hypothetical protein